jgi:hypothetical protein
MSKTGYGNWKGPLPDAVEGEDYRNPCPYGEVLVRGYRTRDGKEVSAYCKKVTEMRHRKRNRGEKASGYTTGIRETNVYSVRNEPDERGVLPRGRNKHGYIVTSFNPDGMSISEDFFLNKKEAEKHKRKVERGEYF